MKNAGDHKCPIKKVKHEQCSTVYIYDIFFTHPSSNEHLGFFHVLATVNSAAVNVGVHVSFQIMVFCRCMSRSGVAGSYGSSIFNFLRTLRTVFHSSCVRGFPFRHTLSSICYLWIFFLTMAILTCVRQYLIVILICVSLKIGPIEHLFLLLLAISFVFVFRSSAHFLIGLFIS